jgi:glyoxylase-like metal-dependent hydrolase (beta-lactamase superfamily II)
MNLLETRGPHSFGPWIVHQIVEWEGEAFPYNFLFPDIPVSEIREASPLGANGRLTESGMIISSTQLFVLQRKGLVVLIELGTGNGKTRPHELYWNNQNLPYLETLASLGIKPEDVDYALLSHLHQDHVGLATTWQDDRWMPTFPRAKYVINPQEWAYWNGLPADDPLWHPCIVDSVLPLVEAGCVQWGRPDELVAGIRIHDAAGHTPGNVLFEVEGSPLWFIGDLLHHPSQIVHPEWPSSSFAFDKEMTTRQRKDYFKRFAAANAVLFAVHLGNPFRIKETSAGQYFAMYD